ncbi:hypothetical protein ACE41O_16370 [Alteromonas macleodii]|uniref:hypothetical protein n=1 Tax=Alteromonas macleodii TaxID=28108 RepID=UPI00314034A4
MHQEEAQAFVLGIPWSMFCMYIYNHISNKVDYKDQSYFGAILLAPIGLSLFLSVVGSWIYIYEVNSGADYGISPFDDWVSIIFPWFTYIFSALSTGCMLWGFWKLYSRYGRAGF